MTDIVIVTRMGADYTSAPSGKHGGSPRGLPGGRTAVPWARGRGHRADRQDATRPAHGLLEADDEGRHAGDQPLSKRVALQRLAPVAGPVLEGPSLYGGGMFS